MNTTNENNASSEREKGNAILQKFYKDNRQLVEKEKKETLIKLGLYLVVTKDDSTEEKVALNVSDELYAKILDMPKAKEILSEETEYPGSVTALCIIGVLVIIGGIIGGFISLYIESFYLAALFFASSLVGSAPCFALSKIVVYLCDIRNKLNNL